MSETRIDPRVVRTRKMLREALVKLIINKPFRLITTHDITELAALNRSTFYAHYQDKFELLSDCIGNNIWPSAFSIEKADRMSITPGEICKARKNGNIDALKFYAQNPTLGLTALEELYLSPYMDSIKKTFHNRTLTYLRWLQPDDSACRLSRESIVEFMGGVFMSLCVPWLKNCMPEPIEIQAGNITYLEVQGSWPALGLEVPKGSILQTPD